MTFAAYARGVHIHAPNHLRMGKLFFLGVGGGRELKLIHPNETWPLVTETLRGMEGLVNPVLNLPSRLDHVSCPYTGALKREN